MILFGWGTPVFALVAFIGYIAWANIPPNMNRIRSTPQPISGAALSSGLRVDPTEGNRVSGRNPKIPVEVSYPIIEDFIGFGGTKRTVQVRLNMKVHEEVLREIALEIKAIERKQYEYTRIYFFLPGKGRDMGPGNTNQWAMADFDQGLRVSIFGLTTEEEQHLRTAPLELPAGSNSLGTWLMDDGVAKTRITIYGRDGGWFYHLQFGGTPKPGALEMDELPAENGRALKMRKGSDRYLILPDGTLELYNGEGKLLHRLPLLVPPPPAN
jgi:hypothetical protein